DALGSPHQTACHERPVTAEVKFLNRTTAALYRAYIMPAAAFAKTPGMSQTEGPGLIDNSAAPPIAPGDNPLLEEWTTSAGVPPFSRIAAEHFLPAYAKALAEHVAEIAAIAADPAPPTFGNTIAALELSGRALDRIDNGFHLLAGAHTDDALLEVERAIAPQIARHWNQIHTNSALFRRIDTVMRGADELGLDAEQKRVVERYYTSFRRAGAALGNVAKRRFAAIMERLAALGTAFRQNVLSDEQAFALRLGRDPPL